MLFQHAYPCTATIVVGQRFRCTDVFSVMVVVKLFVSDCLSHPPIVLYFSSFYLFVILIVFFVLVYFCLEPSLSAPMIKFLILVSVFYIFVHSRSFLNILPIFSLKRINDTRFNVFQLLFINKCWTLLRHAFNNIQQLSTCWTVYFNIQHHNDTLFNIILLNSSCNICCSTNVEPCIIRKNARTQALWSSISEKRLFAQSSHMVQN